MHVFFPLYQAGKPGLKPRGLLVELNEQNSRVQFEKKKPLAVLWVLINHLDTEEYIEFFFLVGYTDEISSACNNPIGEGFKSCFFVLFF